MGTVEGEVDTPIGKEARNQATILLLYHHRFTSGVHAMGGDLYIQDPYI
jgi:hypothetical protein